MINLYIWKTAQGYRIETYLTTIGETVHYIGYTKAGAVKKHREDNGLKGKRLNIIDM